MQGQNIWQKRSHSSKILFCTRKCEPFKASFTIKELRELLTLEGCSSSCVIPQETLLQIKDLLNDSQKKIERSKRRILELMLNYATPKNTNSHKRCLIEFFLEPLKIHVDEKTGLVKSLDLRNKLNGEIVQVPCGLLIYAIGFEHILLNGVPKTEDNRLILR